MAMFYNIIVNIHSRFTIDIQFQHFTDSVNPNKHSHSFLYIIIADQPDVTISFSNKNGIRQLMCIPNGFPAQYEFSNWEHISEFREHIRYLPPAKSGKLYIPFISMETDRHYDRGVYICSVSNNVSVDGRTFVSAEYWLKSSGRLCYNSLKGISSDDSPTM